MEADRGGNGEGIPDGGEVCVYKVIGPSTETKDTEKWGEGKRRADEKTLTLRSSLERVFTRVHQTLRLHSRRSLV